MQSACSRLQNHGHCRGRRKPVIGTVVGSEGAELGDRVRGRSNTHTASTTAVIIFTTVQQVNVMVLAHAVKLHVGLSTDRRVDVTVDLARRPRRQSSKLVNAAPVHSDL